MNIASESGNHITSYRYPVDLNEVSVNRGSDVTLLRSEDMFRTELEYDVNWFRSGRCTFCGATKLNNISIDDRGNLIKCWENVDKQMLAFGSAPEDAP